MPVKEARLSEIHNTLEEAYIIFDQVPFEKQEHYEGAISVTLWKLGYPGSVNILGSEEAETFLMEYFEDYKGSRPTPYKKWETVLH